MVMVGDMFNQARKATVDGLCVALAALLAASDLAQAAPARRPRPGHDTPPQQRGGERPAAGSQASAAVPVFRVPLADQGEAWWPAAR